MVTAQEVAIVPLQKLSDETENRSNQSRYHVGVKMFPSAAVCPFEQVSNSLGSEF